MPVRRLGSFTPAANTLTLLGTADVTCVSSVLVTNTSTVEALVTVYVKPFGAGNTTSEYSYLAYGLPVSAGQSFETFRFALAIGDEVYVQATTAAVNFTSVIVYEAEGRTNVSVSSSQPLAPQVGDIWVNSISDELNVWRGSSWAVVALATPQGPKGEQGDVGPTGPTGAQGLNLNLIGSVADFASLPEFGDVIDDAYYVAAEDTVYAWKDFGWANIGPVRGPAGPQAVNFTILGSVQSVVDLPVSPANTLGNTAYYVEDLQSLFAWDSTSWINVGPIMGPTGPAGPTGAVGPTGPAGYSFALKGTVPTYADLTMLSPSVNDGYYVLSAGSSQNSGGVETTGLHVWDGTEWVNLYGVVGPVGPAGATGPAGDATEYTPLNSADWAVVPANIAYALDELASRVKLLETGQP